MQSAPRRRLTPDERRQEILDAAVRLFGESGYAAVSASKIARAAGVTPALVHHYFGPKREIYLHVIRLEAEEGAMAMAEPRRGPLRARVSQNMDGWLEFVERRRELWLATVGMADGVSDPAISDVLTAARERGIERFLTSYADAIPDTPIARAALHGWLGFNETILRRWLRDRLPREQARSLLIESFLATVRQVIPGAS